MLSEQRLHPASILFSFGKSLKAFAVPGLIVLFTAARRPGPNLEVWMMLMLIPSVLVALVRYWSFRLRYEGAELVIRSGILFRNERHIPYARIQNLDAVQNVVHRLLGVVEVRLETGAGNEPEATISVLPAAAFDEMRRRVFAHRVEAGPEVTAGAPRGASPRVLLHLPTRELLLFGFLENRGMVVIATLYGLLWEVGLLDAVWSPVFEEQQGEGLVREAVATIAQGRALSLPQIALAAAGIAALLLIVRVMSMGWAVVRFYGFRLSRNGEDLRTEYGLFTRVAATVPLRRIQSVTVREGPLFRLFGRVSVRVDTAGGHAGERAGASARDWLAPLIRQEGLMPLMRQVVPDLENGYAVRDLPWQSIDPRAFSRAVKPRLFAAVVLSGLAAVALGWLAVAVAALIVPFSIVAARQYVAHLGWAVTDEVVAFRSGWLWRNLTMARVMNIQAVTLLESPFDRRTTMARVRVDTAGASDRSHRVDIPYLPLQSAVLLHRRLAARAASTAFRW